jgi:broad specificity phosphatase PhoE
MHRSSFLRLVCFTTAAGRKSGSISISSRSFQTGVVLSFQQPPLLQRNCVTVTTTRSTRYFAASSSSKSVAEGSGTVPTSATETATNMSAVAAAAAASRPEENNNPPPPVASTAKRLFLVRHGEVINPGGDRSVYYGAMDVPLSTLGEEEAVAAAQYLAHFALSAVFSSTLSRAIYGAQRVRQLQTTTLGSKEEDVVPLEGFKELDRGDWCGKTLDEIGADLFAKFDACDESATPANGESYPALKRRVLAARDQALDQIQPGQAAAVVSHLQVTRCMLSDALGSPIHQMTKLPVATASITCIDYDYSGATPQQPPQPTVHFQSFKPNVGLKTSKDGAN